MKAVFNKQNVETLPVGTHHDTKLPGLILNVTKTSRRFGVYKWSRRDQKPVRIAIGPWPAFTVEQARIKARELIHAMDRGNAAGQPPTSSKLSKIVDDYEADRRRAGCRKPDHFTKSLLLYCGDWFGRAAATISQEMIEDRHDELRAERGAYAAARFVKGLRAMYQFAKIPSPAKSVSIVRVKHRARVASRDEMAAIREELAKQDPFWRDYFLLSILTGARRNNVSSMRFEDVRNSTWTIPATDAKAGEPITLPLVDEAAEIVEARRKVQGSGFVFPSSGRTGRLTHTWERWNAIRTGAGCPDLTQHDLRRTLISRMAEAGVNPAIAAKAAGHRSVVTTLKVYTVVRQDQVLDALNAIKG